MEFCIDRRMIGAERHLVCSGSGFAFVDDVPRSAMILDGRLDQSDDRCLDVVLRLNGLEPKASVPERFVTAATTAMGGSMAIPMWQHMLPRRDYVGFLRALVDEVSITTGSLNMGYFRDTWCPSGAILTVLQRAHVDGDRWARLVRACRTNRGVVQSFAPDDSGFASIVAYDRFGTRTGRLTVSSGPQVLTLRRDYRDLIDSAYGDDGAVAYVDFAALEARILLYENGRRCDAQDMYASIAQEEFAGSVPRDVVKGAVISEIYGMSRKRLRERLSATPQEFKAFMSRMRSLFNVDELRSRVRASYAKDGHVTNRYGRRIRIDEPSDHILLNSYVQSTGVDVALLGFSSLVNESVTRLPSLRPLFVLHDALIVDVRLEDLRRLSRVKSLRIPGYVQRFPVKVERLVNTVVTRV